MSNISDKAVLKLKMINYSFNSEKFSIIQALFGRFPNQYLPLKMNTLLGSDFQYLVTIHINFILYDTEQYWTDRILQLPSCHCYKTFYSHILLMFLISLGLFVQQAFPAQSNVTSKDEVYPSGTPEWNSPQGQDLGLTLLRRLVNDKHSSLLGRLINYSRSTFYIVGSW